MTLKLTKPAHRISSVADFVEYVMKWRRGGKKPVAFRGESYLGWTTRPKVFRPDVDLYEHERKAIRDLISIHPQEFKDDQTMFDRLVRMQHFELPTRLLDVSINPLVALYFATSEQRIDGKLVDGKVQALFLPDERQRYFDSDRVSLMANMSNLTSDEKRQIAAAQKKDIEEFNEDEAVKKLLSFVRLEKPYFEAKVVAQHLKLPVFVRPKMSNRRIIAQSGAFIIYGIRSLARSTEDEELRLSRAIVPAEKKSEIRDQLEQLGIHASSLFPEIDKAAGYIVKRYTN